MSKTRGLLTENVQILSLLKGMKNIVIYGLKSY